MKENDFRGITQGAQGGFTNVTSSHCSRFSRRTDVNMFNMMDYTSCENCRHSTADSQCLVKAGTMPEGDAGPGSLQS